MIKMLKNYDYSKYDILLVILIVAMGATGILLIRSATGDSLYLKQLIGFIAAFIIMVVVSLVDYVFIGKCAILLYLFNLSILIAVKVAGVTYMGAQRWFKIGSETNGISIQPSELSKILIIICMSKFISIAQKKINSLITLLIFCVTSAVPIFLVYIQKDLSTSLVMLFIFCVILYVGELSYKIIGIVLAIGIPGVVIFIWYALQPYANVLAEYQLNRIRGFLNQEEYSQTTQWQQDNSILAIGSGQLYGKGLNNNTITSVKNRISQAECDFIFSVAGEELGFIGCGLILLGMLLIVIKCILIAKDAKDTLGKLIASGIAAMLSFQTFVNVGVATAILPNTGLPMPIISYGLSSLMSTMIGFGLVLNVGLQKQKYRGGS